MFGNEETDKTTDSSNSVCPHRYLVRIILVTPWHCLEAGASTQTIARVCPDVPGSSEVATRFVGRIRLQSVPPKTRAHVAFDECHRLVLAIQVLLSLHQRAFASSYPIDSRALE